jgi:hypothetical protein
LRASACELTRCCVGLVADAGYEPAVVEETQDAGLAGVDGDAAPLGCVEEERDDAVVAGIGVPGHAGAAIDYEGKFHVANDDEGV